MTQVHACFRRNIAPSRDVFCWVQEVFPQKTWARKHVERATFLCKPTCSSFVNVCQEYKYYISQCFGRNTEEFLLNRGNRKRGWETEGDKGGEGKGREGSI